VSGIQAKGPVKEATIEVVVTRADGTVEDHGVVASYYRNPLVRAVRLIKPKKKRS